MRNLQPLDSIPFAVRWMFRPVGHPNEAGLPENYPLLEVPDALLIKLSFAAWCCFLAGIIGVFGWPFLIAASIMIIFTIHLAANLQNQIWRNADQLFHSSKSSETSPTKCDKILDCDMFDWQGMKPLHTSMLVKRLQLNS